LLTRIRMFARSLIVYAIRNYSLLEQLDPPRFVISYASS
jgi:hypothetical protein